MGETNIGWCTHSLNFIKWWCAKHSEGCKHCYMMDLARRYPQNAADRPVWRGNAYKELVKLPPNAEVFVGDMYDLFHEQMPLEFIRRAFQQLPEVGALMMRYSTDDAMLALETVCKTMIEREERV